VCNASIQRQDDSRCGAAKIILWTPDLHNPKAFHVWVMAQDTARGSSRPVQEAALRFRYGHLSFAPKTFVPTGASQCPRIIT
jgi:hypothetical protein